ncbi:GGDEF domain-containing protein [Methylobacterium terricola]|uniref:diguanylate cyclase n=1 Tax=Methylobacterium terricola TaxID=2583531 RepID=A0A5C4LFU8_9HYPH|nr:GGDEF domain-containing protein [Methylobacterium terricola]TNC12001.1 GGDEF domain-containing protein [Methylobacterium terricola]
MAVESSAEAGGIGSLDWLLRFDARAEARYEAEHGRDRAAAMLRLLLIGLILYNIFNFTSAWMTPDIAGLCIVLRLLVVTPITLILAWRIVRVGPVLRECLALVTAIGAVATPLVLFWLTRAPLGNYTFFDTSLVVIYANVLFAMRFRHALVFTAVSLLGAALALATKPELDLALRSVLGLQFATACAVSLYANYCMERRRCGEYLRTLAAQLASEAAEAAGQRYKGLSGTDALTGLPNRRILDETAAAWCADRRAAALMMIDVDHFKSFNDTLGHPEGDACLRRVAALFTTFASGPDILAARFGGEEFTLILRDAGTSEAVRLAAALVRAVAVLGIAHPGRPDDLGIVTVSIGVALKGAGAASPPDALFAEADQALYQAKRRGRKGYALATRDGAVGAIPSVARSA